MTMKKNFYVLDAEGNVSFSAKRDATEHFTTMSAALTRANELAVSEPGKPVHIASTVEIVMCEISAPKRVGR